MQYEAYSSASIIPFYYLGIFKPRQWFSMKLKKKVLIELQAILKMTNTKKGISKCREIGQFDLLYNLLSKICPIIASVYQ